MSTSSSSIDGGGDGSVESSGSHSPERRSVRIRSQVVRHAVAETESSGESYPSRKKAKGKGSRGGARGRGVGRGRGKRKGRIVAEGPNRADEALHIIQTRQTRMKARVATMETEQLRDLVVEMINAHPGLVFNILEPADQQPGGYHPQPGDNLPDWCVCTKCREMPTEAEKVCCRRQDCVSLLPDFQVLILDEAVLALARMYRRDVLVINDEVDVRKANRHQGYRQFVLWQHGMLGAGQRMVIPSCCVWKIRDKFPDAFGQYTGFKPTRLA